MRGYGQLPLVFATRVVCEDDHPAIGHGAGLSDQALLGQGAKPVLEAGLGLVERGREVGRAKRKFLRV